MAWWGSQDERDHTISYSGRRTHTSRPATNRRMEGLPRLAPQVARDLQACRPRSHWTSIDWSGLNGAELSLRAYGGEAEGEPFAKRRINPPGERTPVRRNSSA